MAQKTDNFTTIRAICYVYLLTSLQPTPNLDWTAYAPEAGDVKILQYSASNASGFSRKQHIVHQVIEPPILYFGTPVVIISTTNEDGSANLSPMSSAWWLGWSCMLGLDASSQTTINLRRTGECVLNLPSAGEVSHVDALARKTGTDPMPFHKAAMGWEVQRDKFGIAGLSPQASTSVAPPRVAECPIQLEAVLVNDYAFAEADPRMLIPARALEVRITKVYAADHLLSQTHEDRFDPDSWNPLFMSFLKFYARGENVHPSHLSKVPQEAWAGRAPRPKS